MQRRYMHIPREEQKAGLYLFALQHSQDQLRQWSFEVGCPRQLQERLQWAGCGSLQASSSDQTSTRV